MQTLIYSLIALGVLICILWFFTGFRIYVRENKYLVVKDYYLEWYNPFTGRLNQQFLFTL